MDLLKLMRNPVKVIPQSCLYINFEMNSIVCRQESPRMLRQLLRPIGRRVPKQMNNETFTSQIPVNIDPIISLSTISSNVDGKNESAQYTTSPILDTLATMKRPQQKGS